MAAKRKNPATLSPEIKAVAASASRARVVQDLRRLAGTVKAKGFDADTTRPAALEFLGYANGGRGNSVLSVWFNHLHQTGENPLLAADLKVALGLPGKVIRYCEPNMPLDGWAPWSRENAADELLEAAGNIEKRITPDREIDKLLEILALCESVPGAVDRFYQQPKDEFDVCGPTEADIAKLEQWGSAESIPVAALSALRRNLRNARWHLGDADAQRKSTLLLAVGESLDSEETQAAFDAIRLKAFSLLSAAGSEKSGDNPSESGAVMIGSKAAIHPEISVEAKALAILVDHPDWSVEQIAVAAGTTRSTLYNKPKFLAARRAVRASAPPRGSKSDGTMEAIGDDDIDFDSMDG